MDIENLSSAALSGFEASLAFNQGINPSNLTVQIPDISGQESVAITVDDLFVLVVMITIIMYWPN